MAYLLDTHTLIWFAEDDNQLSAKAKSIIQEPNNKIYVSAASFFEMAIKIKIGKLPSHLNISRFWTDAEEHGFDILPITHQHLRHYQVVPLHSDHRDPFDRLIIATALAESLAIIAADKKFDLYSMLITTIW